MYIQLISSASFPEGFVEACADSCDGSASAAPVHFPVFVLDI